MDIKSDINASLPAMTSEAYGHSELDFSLYHLIAAIYFLKESKRIEKQYSEGKSTPAAVNAYMACALGGIMAVVSSLEATINELFLSVASSQEEWQKPLNDLLTNWQILESSVTITDLLKKKHTLQKYQIACKTLGAQPFIENASPYQELTNFIALRNELTHYKPEWSEQRKICDRLESKLKNKYPLNPLSNSGLFFPTKCLTPWGQVYNVGP